ncbi:MAG: hypothetical protein E4H40_01535 [Candidatus Brocadiia bacterium]|nr:MAG: hypothetical protein E4H40_01535 [Candidatus Brocadiia bacterium]
MKALRIMAVLSVIAIGCLVLAGCGKKTDESKPVAEVKAEAAKMDVAQLKKMAEQYKAAIVARKADIEKVTAKLKDIPVTEMGEKAKAIQADIEKLKTLVTALKERFEIYYQQLKEKGGDITGLAL